MKVIFEQLVTEIKFFLADRFSLNTEKADEEQIIASIRKGIEFKGINLWALIFAIMVASVGLNVNSTAVIIGAMLISPLMGPIMGIGLGVGINDFDLIKVAFKNLSIAVLISVLTSALYFFISPLDDAQSELLSRTTPTIWDVLIAFFGGLAGIVAGSVKDKGNVIPGVAIATALMPPLCTAGFGIGTGNWLYFLGAFYLFSINTVMISLSTFLIVKFLKFKSVTFLDVKQEKRVKRLVTIITVATVLPSLFLGYKIVNQTIYERNAKNFIAHELNFSDTQIIQHDINFNKKTLTLSCIGKNIEQPDIDRAILKLPDYHLNNTQLILRQGFNSAQMPDVNSLRSSVFEDLFDRKEADLQQKQSEIDSLKERLTNVTQIHEMSDDIVKELKALYPNAQSLAISRSEVFNTEGRIQDTVCIALIKMRGSTPQSQRQQMEKWLLARTNCKKAKVVYE